MLRYIDDAIFQRLILLPPNFENNIQVTINIHIAPRKNVL